MMLYVFLARNAYLEYHTLLKSATILMTEFVEIVQFVTPLNMNFFHAFTISHMLINLDTDLQEIEHVARVQNVSQGFIKHLVALEH
jgi:hypothetical protein